MFLAGDIGGTKTRLGIFSETAGLRAPLAEATVLNSRYPDFETLLREFLAPVGQTLHRACLGVAGPVLDGQCKATNLPWILREKEIEQAFRMASVRLINDVEATAYAIPLLAPADLRILSPGEAIPGGNKALVAPGTGLGEAFITREGGRYRVYASEGGHADYAPGSALELELLMAMREKFGRVSQERVCSGKGIPQLYQFLKSKGYGEEPAWLSTKLNLARDQTPVIIASAMDHEQTCDLCKKTLDLFVSLLGAEAGNLALKVLATGGVYLAGGIPPRILPLLESGRFMEAFRRKGRMSALMARIPVSVILHPGAALMGAAFCALKAP